MESSVDFGGNVVFEVFLAAVTAETEVFGGAD